MRSLMPWSCHHILSHMKNVHPCILHLDSSTNAKIRPDDPFLATCHFTALMLIESGWSIAHLRDMDNDHLPDKRQVDSLTNKQLSPCL